MDNWRQELLIKNQELYEIETNKNDPYYILKERIRYHFLDNWKEFRRTEEMIYLINESDTIPKDKKFSMTFPLIGNFMGMTCRKAPFPNEYYRYFLDLNIKYLEKYKFKIADNMYGIFRDGETTLKCSNWMLFSTDASKKYFIPEPELEFLYTIYNKFFDKKTKEQSYLGMIYPHFQYDGYDGKDKINIIFSGVLK